MHNVEGDKNYKAYLSPQYFDAQLTQLGWQQVRQTAKCLTQKKRKNNSRNAANAVQEKHGGNMIKINIQAHIKRINIKDTKIYKKKIQKDNILTP